MKKTLQEIYDGFAQTYEENRGLFDMSTVFEDFYRRIPAGRKEVLDLGCGAGEPFARMFIDRGCRVVGVDFSQEMLALASRCAPEMERIHADMREVEFAPARFDAITAVYSLFHVPSDDHPGLFAKLYRCLAPGGMLLFTYATREYTGEEVFDGYKRFFGQELYYSHRTPDELYAMLARCGFRLEAADYRSIGGEVFLWVTASRPVDTSTVAPLIP